MASQLAFVPLLFALPVAVVPLAFALSLAISALIDVVRRDSPPHSLLRVLGNSWSAVFPCLAFALEGTSPRHAGPVLLVAALAAQFGGDFGTSVVHVCLARGATLRSHLADAWVYVIDAALSVVGLVVAEEMHVAWYAVLAVVPLLGVMAMFAREREGRLGNLLELNDTYRGTALVLGDVIAADDGYTGEHSQDVVDLARAAGERLGREGLAGDRIPLEARIITACDSWNAMRTDRSYRRALSLDNALTEMVRNVGTQFDARVVKAMLEVVAAEAPPGEHAADAGAQPEARPPLPRPAVRERELVSAAGP